MNTSTGWGTRILFILFIVVLIWAILATKGCSGNKADLASMDAYNKSLKDTALQTIKAKDGLVTKYKSQVEADKATITEIVNENASLKKTLSDMKVKVGNIQSVTQVETKIVLVHDTIKYKSHDTVKIGGDGVPFADSCKDYNIQGIAAPTQVIFTQVSFKDSSTVVSESQGGFLRKESYLLKISHSNPLINTTGIQSIILKPQKKWYQTTIFKFGVGIVGGIIIDRVLLK